MTSLVVCLGEGKGTWGAVSSLFNAHDWNGIFVIGGEFFKEKFSHEKKFEFVVVDSRKPVQDIKNDVVSALNSKISGDVALNVVSGSGKEHMAIFSALISLGVGIRLVVSENGLKEV